MVGMFQWTTILYGCLLALIDVIMMPITKLVNKGVLTLGWMVIPTLVYALDPWIFLKSLSTETMVIMNMVWNMVSNIAVTYTGLILFGEKISMIKGIGIALSFISILLMTWE
jgi:multidrug transporter EmrE-like cation transporter